MKCRFCGTELEKDARFCHICGQSAPVDRSEGGFCPHCDVRLPDVAVFCPHCGTKLGFSRLRESLPARETVQPAAAPSGEAGKDPAPAAREAPVTALAEHKPAPPKKAGKKPRKSGRSGSGGGLLALLIVILILCFLGVFLYMEANSHGLGVGEYASSLLPGGETEKPARWSDLKSEESADQTADMQEQAPAEEELRTRQAYALYRGLLESRRDRIEAYNWQLEGTESRPIFLRDVCGDELPELIWVESAPGESEQAATLFIATIRNGSGELVYSERWDVQAGGGFGYYLFQQQGDKALHSYSSFGEDSWTERYAVLSEQGDALVRSEQLTSELSAARDGEGANETRSFRRMGEPVSEDQWLAAVEELRAQTASVLMLNRYAGYFAESWTEQNGCPALTFQDALSVLSEGGALSP